MRRLWPAHSPQPRGWLAAIRGHTPDSHLEGPRSLSQFIHHAVMAEVRRLEERYNDGEPWPGVAARELPQGRPMGS